MYNGSSWTKYTTSNSNLPENNVYAICSDDYGNIWFGTDNKGIVKYDSTNMAIYSVFDGLANNSISNIAVDQNNTKWFATAGGASRASCVNPEPDFVSDTACYPGSTEMTNLTEKADVTTKYEWDINNNGSVEYTTSDVNHAFGSFGDYDVELNAINDNCSLSVVKPVRVNQLPDVIILPEDTSVVCSGSYQVLQAVIKNYSGSLTYTYEWSSGLQSALITVDETGDYYVTVTQGNCWAASAPAHVEMTEPYNSAEICLVTVDSATGKNRIIWERTPNAGIESYNVYKLFGSVYQPIGNVPFDDMSMFIDYSSFPGVNASRYAISVIDTCGNESEKSPYHQTIHLGVSMGLGPNEVVLDWTPYTDESIAFDPDWYFILRGSSPENLVILDSISSVFTEWNDTNSLGSKYYKIGVKKPAGCYPSSSAKASSGPYSQSLSNLEDNGIIATNIRNIDYRGLSIYPNPFREKTTISFPNPQNGEYTMNVFDITGKKVRTVSNINTGYIFLEKNQMEDGIYFIEIAGEKIFKGKLIIKSQ